MGNTNNMVKKTIPTNKHKAKMPQLVAPINALDQETADKLYENQKIVVEHLKKWSEQVISIKKNMREIIKEEVTRQFEDNKIMLEGLYKKTLICAKLLMDKGHFSQEDINKKYEELKERKDG